MHNIVFRTRQQVMREGWVGNILYVLSLNKKLKYLLKKFLEFFVYWRGCYNISKG